MGEGVDDARHVIPPVLWRLWFDACQRLIGWTLHNPPLTPNQQAAYAARIDTVNTERGHTPQPRKEP